MFLEFRNRHVLVTHGFPSTLVFLILLKQVKNRQLLLWKCDITSIIHSHWSEKPAAV